MTLLCRCDSADRRCRRTPTNVQSKSTSTQPKPKLETDAPLDRRRPRRQVGAGRLPNELRLLRQVSLWVVRCGEATGKERAASERLNVKRKG